LNVDGITATVQAAQEENKTAFTAMKQTADSLSLAVQTIRQNGTEKLSTAFGLSVDGSAVRIHREGSEMENRLDEKGMYVLRSGETMLSADARGVVATDVTVRNYLSVAHARFEDYGSDRTACFFV
jgi:methylthioribose-1-phosphate isomerase